MYTPVLVMLIIWYLIPVLAMLFLLLDTRPWYLPCYTYYLISDIGTCHAILIACYLTPDIIILDTWHAISRYCYTWPDIVALVVFYIFMTITFTGTWHDYYTVTRYLVLLNSWTPVLLNSWTSVLLNPWKKGDSWYYTSDIKLLLIPVVG